MVRLAGRFYVLSIAGGYGMAVFLRGLQAWDFSLGIWTIKGETEVVVFFFVALLYFVAVFTRLAYKMWGAIQDGHAGLSPRLAVALLLIPVVNAYGIFRVLLGFVKDYNAYIERHAVPVPPLSRRLFLAVPILFFFDAVPWIWWAAGFVNAALLALLAGTICEAVNSLPGGERGEKG